MATKANLTIDQGTDYTTTITLTDDGGNTMNLSGYSGQSQIRKYYTSATAVSFDVAITANTGEVTLSLSSNTTANIVAGRYVYDAIVTDNVNLVSRIVEGIVTITPSVTR